ncbi:type I pullulanase [uncultured Muribaculum sp.]|uniref:type I pullulanase n=1 Tax=uncultured Muribaculum sp. TaxID=1918613 RepID=UPI002591C8AB|nr:type I pullulanase [Bacteroides intestinalis]
MNLNLMNLCKGTILATAVMCGANATAANPDARFEEFATYDGNDLELVVNATGTHFTLWSPEAEDAKVLLYPTDRNSAPIDTLTMLRSENGTWRVSVPQQLYGKFYTFRIKYHGKWLAETPGVWAKALGTNGERAAIIDFANTNPAGWENDKGPAIKHINDAVIYEMHHRDFSVHPNSGIVNKGKFIAMTEEGTKNTLGDKTGIDHLKELGITHVHILPSYDFNSVDESQLPSNQYNWGYDPVNYNTPDGSYSTNPANPETRIREMKEMVQALHNAGIGVVMDVVYNHTAQNDDSNFSLTAPGYYYRHRDDGSYSDASGCGNETASERQQMRDFIVNSVKYWADEYHIDGFRFDLMAIHDTTTMNQVARELKKINPDIFVYGEGWTAGDSPLPKDQRALKDNVSAMPQIAVFSDDLRDAVKGHYSDASDRGFATGKPGLEETVKIGIVGATAHPQVNYALGNNSKKPYALAPTQVINYVSCHDDLMLTDKLAKSMPDATEAERQRADKLAQTIVFTSQGTPFMFAGEEIFRNKKGVHNSYKSPDSINAIDWNLKHENADIYNYYRELIKLRKSHPAFRMTTTEDVAKHLVFDKVKSDNLISYSLKDHANGDPWKEIKVIFNGADNPQEVKIPAGKWLVIARDGQINADGMGQMKGGKTLVEPRSALIIAKEK